MAQIPLRTLDLSATPTIQDEELKQSLRMQPNGFQRLNVKNCTQLTDRVAAIIGNHTSLTILDISKTDLTDDFLMQLSEYDIKLTDLNIADCPNITVAGFLKYLTTGKASQRYKANPAFTRELEDLARQTKKTS